MSLALNLVWIPSINTTIALYWGTMYANSEQNSVSDDYFYSRSFKMFKVRYLRAFPGPPIVNEQGPARSGLSAPWSWQKISSRRHTVATTVTSLLALSICASYVFFRSFSFPFHTFLVYLAQTRRPVAAQR